MNLKTMKKTMKTLRKREVNSELEARKLRGFINAEHQKNKQDEEKQLQAVTKKEAVEAKAIQFVATILSEDDNEPGEEPGTPGASPVPAPHSLPVRSASVSLTGARSISPGRDSVSPGRASVSSLVVSPPGPSNAEQVARVAKLRDAQKRKNWLEGDQKGGGH